MQTFRDSIDLAREKFRSLRLCQTDARLFCDFLNRFDKSFPRLQDFRRFGVRIIGWRVISFEFIDFHLSVEEILSYEA